MIDARAWAKGRLVLLTPVETAKRADEKYLRRRKTGSGCSEASMGIGGVKDEKLQTSQITHCRNRWITFPRSSSSRILLLSRSVCALNARRTASTRRTWLGGGGGVCVFPAGGGGSSTVPDALMGKGTAERQDEDLSLLRGRDARKMATTFIASSMGLLPHRPFTFRC